MKKPKDKPETPSPKAAENQATTGAAEAATAGDGAEATAANNKSGDGGAEPETKAAATIDLADPLPAGIPPEALEHAALAVRSKPERGRWRAGRHFTRVESVIPLSELTAAQVVAIKGDPELVVVTRVNSKPD